MSSLNSKQLQYECESWKRSLHYIMDENIHLKNRLSEILKDKFDKYLLEEVEDFQSRFIKNDEVIGLLRNDIAELNEYLDQGISREGIITSEIGRKLNKVRTNFMVTEKQFGQLKSDFNNFLSENIL